MSNIWERIRDWVVLLGLIVTSIVTMVNFNGQLLRSLRAGALQVTARVEQNFAWAGNYLRALDENDELRANNVDLSSQLARLRQADQENVRLRNLLALRDTTDGQLLTTRILSKDVTQQRNFLTLDAGAEDGVEEGMAVVDDEGIIGKVVLTSRRYAVVQSYLNTDFRVPARIQDVGTDGIISWDGVDRMRLLLNFVPKTEPVVPGQEIVTYGSLTFPDGYVVGTVDTAFANEGRNDFQIYLTPATPIGRADYVFVILAKPDPVIEELMEVASQQ